MFVDQQGFIATLVYTEPFVATNNLANMRCMPETPEQQLKGFIAKFDPVMGKQIRECRSAMRKRFPTANELVYDNYNFFVIGYCTTERPSDCVVSLAANSKEIGQKAGGRDSSPYLILPLIQVPITGILTLWADRMSWIRLGHSNRVPGRFVHVH